MRKGSIRNISNYVIVFLVILFNCSPFFLFVNRQFWIVLFSLLMVITFFLKKKFIHKKILLVLAATWLLIIIQSITFGGISPAAVYLPIWLFLTPFLVYSIMGLSFFKYLFKIIYFIAIFTSIIYFLQLSVPSFSRLLSNTFENIYPYSWADWPRSILVYSIPRESGYFFPRNSGIFHEPGAYAIYLIVAIIINTILTNNSFNKKNVFLSLVLLTTFSTTGYIMLFILLTYTIWSIKINIAFKLIILSLYVIFSLGIFQNNLFLLNKIEEQYKTQSEAIERGEKQQTGRFYYFAETTKAFLHSPIFGRGLIRATAYTEEGEGIMGLGFIGMFARYGIIFGVFYMWLFYKGLRVFSYLHNIKKNYVIIAFVTINIGLLSQSFFFHISFVIIFIVGLLPPLKKPNNHRNFNVAQSTVTINQRIETK